MEHKWNTESLAPRGVDNAVSGRLNKQSQKLCVGKSIYINEERSYDEKDEDIPEKVTLAKKKFILKELLNVFHDIESTMDRMLEIDTNLERSMTKCGQA